MRTKAAPFSVDQVDALIERLRAHAEAHKYIANQDPEQKQWMRDLYDAADALKSMQCYLAGHITAIATCPLEPTHDMIEAGAQRLVSWEDGCTWPESWDALTVAAARNEAERVWRSMWCAAQGIGE